MRELMADKERQEAVLKASDLDYVLVQPVGLTDAPASGDWLASARGETRKMRISRKDVAAFIAEEIRTRSITGKPSPFRANANRHKSPSAQYNYLYNYLCHYYETKPILTGCTPSQDAPPGLEKLHISQLLRRGDEVEMPLSTASSRPVRQPATMSRTSGDAPFR